MSGCEIESYSQPTPACLTREPAPVRLTPAPDCLVTLDDLLHNTPLMCARIDWASSGLRAALEDTVLVDAGWLVELANKGGILPRCQEVPVEARVTLEDMAAYTIDKFAVLVVSYPWLDCDHPDPLGEQLRKIAFVLDAFDQHVRLHGGRCGVFIDYCALPQISRAVRSHVYEHDDGTVGWDDDRTPEEKASFKRALRSINLWYANPHTYVLLVSTSLPTGGKYVNWDRPYYNRGWCVAEKLMSSMVKDADCLIDLEELSGFETHFSELWRNKRVGRSPPEPPDDFHERLRLGATTGTLRFTNSNDIDVVANIYEKAFLSTMADATRLNYEGLGWTDGDLSMISRSLRFAAGSMVRLVEINLSDNPIGDIGCADLVDALRAGAAPHIRTVCMQGTLISDAHQRHARTAADGSEARYRAPISGAEALRAALIERAQAPEWVTSAALRGEPAALLAARTLRRPGDTGLRCEYYRLSWGNAEVSTFSRVLVDVVRRSVPCLPIVEIDLSQNQIGAEGCAALCDALKADGMPRLISLNLDVNRLGAAGARRLGLFLQEPTFAPRLGRLSVASNAIGEEAFLGLMEATKSRMRMLRGSLSLRGVSGNCLSDGVCFSALKLGWESSGSLEEVQRALAGATFSRLEEHRCSAHER